MATNDGIGPIEVKASDTVFNLSDFALEHGIGSVRVSGGPLIPFVVTLVNDERLLTRYAADNIADGVKAAMESIANLPQNVQAYAIAYDTTLNLGGNKYDAVVVDVEERGSEFAHQFAQRYKTQRFLSKFQLIGNPMYLGKIPSRFDKASSFSLRQDLNDNKP